MESLNGRSALQRNRHLLILCAWALMALVIAYQRSMWCDEWNHVQDLKNGIFWAARELMNKPSPFHPGEAVFNGIAKAIVTLFHGPQEIWARVQGVFWGTATLAIALMYPREGERQRYLPWLVGFSAALISLSLQMRPYASLYFSGALAAQILHDGGIKNRFTQWMSWVLILFGHLYGICFLAFALVLSGQYFKEIKKIIVGLATVALVLLRVKVVKSQGGDSVLPVIEYVRQIVGTLTNPHKASLILGPLFVVGLVRLYRRERLLTLKLLALLFVTIVGPTYATISAKYFFVPRQIVAGCFAFAIFAGEGLEWIRERLGRFQSSLMQSFVPGALCFVATVVPWTLSTIMKIPPFPDQPFNRFRELTQEIAAQNYKHILFLDTCNYDVMRDYMDDAMKMQAVRRPNWQLEGHPMSTVCWGDRVCMSWISDFAYCNSSVDDYHAGGRGVAVVNHRSFDMIVHSLMKPLVLDRTDIAIQRDW